LPENVFKTKILLPAKQRKMNFKADISAQNPYKYLDRFTAMAQSLLEVFNKEHPRVSTPQSKEHPRVYFF
jgi:hypothetical protein